MNLERAVLDYIEARHLEEQRIVAALARGREQLLRGGRVGAAEFEPPELFVELVCDAFEGKLDL